jgi:GTP-binding protein
MDFTVAIIGRERHKSTLFNRLVGRRVALVDNSERHRDRREGRGRLGDIEFVAVDRADRGRGRELERPYAGAPSRVRNRRCAFPDDTLRLPADRAFDLVRKAESLRSWSQQERGSGGQAGIL